MRRLREDTRVVHPNLSRVLGLRVGLAGGSPRRARFGVPAAEVHLAAVAIALHRALRNGEPRPHDVLNLALRSVTGGEGVVGHELLLGPDALPHGAHLALKRGIRGFPVENNLAAVGVGSLEPRGFDAVGEHHELAAHAEEPGARAEGAARRKRGGTGRTAGGQLARSGRSRRVSVVAAGEICGRGKPSRVANRAGFTPRDAPRRVLIVTVALSHRWGAPRAPENRRARGNGSPEGVALGAHFQSHCQKWVANWLDARRPEMCSFVPIARAAVSYDLDLAKYSRPGYQYTRTSTRRAVVEGKLRGLGDAQRGAGRGRDASPPRLGVRRGEIPRRGDARGRAPPGGRPPRPAQRRGRGVRHDQRRWERRRDGGCVGGVDDGRDLLGEARANATARSRRVLHLPPGPVGGLLGARDPQARRILRRLVPGTAPPRRHLRSSRQDEPIVRVRSVDLRSMRPWRRSESPRGVHSSPPRRISARPSCWSPGARHQPLFALLRTLAEERLARDDRADDAEAPARCARSSCAAVKTSRSNPW